MSNILTSSVKQKILTSFIKDYPKNDLTKDYLESLIQQLIPQSSGINLINYKIKEDGSPAACFYPKTNTLIIQLKKLKKWLSSNLSILEDTNTTQDIKIKEAFLILFVIAHEIEHSYQYLFAEGLVTSPYQSLTLAYKGIMDTLKPANYLLPRPFKRAKKVISCLLYKKNENFLVLERNANIEALDLLCKCAQALAMNDIYQIFNDILNTFMTIGYQESALGSFAETYQKLLISNKYRQISVEKTMTDYEKAYYGFTISENQRQNILKLNRGGK